LWVRKRSGQKRKTFKKDAKNPQSEGSLLEASKMVIGFKGGGDGKQRSKVGQQERVPDGRKRDLKSGIRKVSEFGARGKFKRGEPAD